MRTEICMIIPAAGQSRRHPPNKLLVRLGKNTVIEKTVSTFIDFSMDVVIVVGYQMEKMKPILKKRFGNRIRIVENPRYKTGLASSIRAAILAAGHDYSYWGFCNGDKPFISRNTAGFLLNELREKHPLILAPSYENKIGHPIFFSTSLKKELLSITGDIGGREILQNHFEEVLRIPVDDEGVVTDMDRYLENYHAS